jgi:predicted nucleic acid-binding protein
MIDIDKFKADCLKGKCNRTTVKSTQCLKEYKQKLCFDKYNKQLDKNKVKHELQSLKNKNKDADIDYKWIEVRETVKLRDGNMCRLYPTLTKEEKIYLLKSQKDNLWLNKTLDPAHVLSRSSTPCLVYDPENIVILGRLFHSRLDNLQNPLTGESVSVEERNQWWIRIVGQELWDSLNDRSKKK